MTKTRVEGNDFYFVFGFVSFVGGVLLLCLLLTNVQRNSPLSVLEWLFFVALSSFLTYGGIALLLQAGLGAFWNQRLNETTRKESRLTSELVDLDDE